MYRRMANTCSVHSQFILRLAMSFLPHTSTFQDFNANQRRKATKEWLDIGDWIRYGKLK